jgi:hypothetical protein
MNLKDVVCFIMPITIFFIAYAIGCKEAKCHKSGDKI